MSAISPMPVLVVEDDEPTQHLLRVVLRRSGHESDFASNGHEAIARLEAGSYAAIILDMMMPGSGGDDVLAYLATREPVPVIVCSAAGPAALAGLDMRLVKAIVRKPFDIDQLVATIAAVTTAGT